jgi:hypothetical protein
MASIACIENAELDRSSKYRSIRAKAMSKCQALIAEKAYLAELICSFVC